MRGLRLIWVVLSLNNIMYFCSMKKLLLTLLLVSTILSAQAQCQAYFGYMQNGSTTIFTDSSTMQSTNFSATWSWDFGDGNTSTQQNPIHTYSNGIYSASLIVTFFDSTIINYCTSVYCDSIFIGNAPPASWDCNPATGCFDPGTGLGQYSTLTACQTACGVIPSWDCDPVSGCYDPGTGLGLYNTLISCQSNCSGAAWYYCDSMTASGLQSQITMQVNGVNTFIDYWVTTANDGTILGEDSMSTTHNIFNYNPSTSLPYDTINVCITYTDANGLNTCCETWIWDANLGVWAKMGSVTSIGEINSFDKKLIKVVDMLGRETSINSNQTLFFIYEDGTIEKRYIINKK